MKMLSVAVLFSAIAFASASTEHTDASPVSKVLEMISDLQSKIIGEGKEAQKVFDSFSEWCEDRSKEIAFSIKTGKDDVAELEAAISEETALIGSLTAKVDKLSGDIANDESDLKAATEIRASEHADFAAEESELLDVIDTLERAIGIIEKEMNGGASMMQLKNAGSIAQAITALVQASAFSAADGVKLTALVQQQSAANEDDASLGAPAGAVYSNQSGGILEVLNNLLEKAQGQLDEARKTEQTNLNEFNLLKQSIEDEIKYGKQDLAKAKKGIAASSEKKSTAEGDLSRTSSDLSEDTNALSQLHGDCMTKAQDFEEETKSRDEELGALAKAKSIIAEATGAAALNQVSFVQRSMDAHLTVVRFVRDLARRSKSQELALLASRVSSVGKFGSADDQFAKIKGLIRDMIQKLESEAEEDATKKAWCDKELRETHEKRTDKTGEVEKLSTKIDEMTARSSQLKEEVATLENELSSISTAQANMDKLREEEHGVFVSTKAELDKGLKGIKLALKVLQEYYAKDAAHGSAQGAGSGIIGLLEVCESDFAKELAEVTQVENTAQAAYDKETKENEVEVATKEADAKYKGQEATDLAKATAEAKSDRSGVQSELNAVMQYLSQLEAQCIEKAASYEEIKAKRDAEINGLKEALEILQNEAALLQTGARRILRGVKLHTA